MLRLRRGVLVMAALTAAACGASSDAEALSGSTSEGTEDVAMRACESTQWPTIPSDADDLAQPGPWPVGARTVQIDGRRVEVWYPAVQAGDVATYDIRELLPQSERGKIPDDANPLQRCDCFRDAPIAQEGGQFPVVVFVHGTAGYRSQSLPHMTHWASWGFVVLAADHPGLNMTDLLGSLCGQPEVDQNLRADVEALLAAARGETPGLEFVLPILDPTRVALAGHSAGGRAVGAMADLAQVIVPMAAGGNTVPSSSAATLVLSGTADTVVEQDEQVVGYEESPLPKWFVGLANAGHLAFTEICSLQNADGQGLLEVAQAYEVCGAAFAADYFQCSDELLPDAESWPIINDASTAVLLDVLHCQDRSGALRGLVGKYRAVSAFWEAF